MIVGHLCMLEHCRATTGRILLLSQRSWHTAFLRSLVATYDAPKTFQLRRLGLEQCCGGCLLQLFVPCLTMTSSRGGEASSFYSRSSILPPHILVSDLPIFVLCRARRMVCITEIGRLSLCILETHMLTTELLLNSSRGKGNPQLILGRTTPERVQAAEISPVCYMVPFSRHSPCPPDNAKAIHGKCPVSAWAQQ